jgi:hypothetical protein
MISYFCSIGKKPSAWFFLLLFYFQLTASAYQGIYFKYFKSTYTHYDTRSGLKPPTNIPEYKGPNFNTIKKKNQINNIEGELNKLRDLPKSIESTNKAISNNIGGPGQPETKSFKSVEANDMVNLFTGDFSYNIPLLDVGGYPVNLFYNAGVRMEQEASWVGLGWNINPGTITRDKRGMPDDFKGGDANDGDIVTKTQSIKDDITVGVGAGFSPEVFGNPVGPSVSGGVFWNNKKGFGMEAGAQFTFQKGIKNKAGTCKTAGMGLGLGFNLNSQNGLGANVSMDVDVTETDKKVKIGNGTSLDFNSRSGINQLKIDFNGSVGNFNTGNINYNISFARPSYTPTMRMPLSRFSSYLSLKLGGELYAFHGNINLNGYLSKASLAESDKTQTKPAFGYMYYNNAVNNDDAILDYNRHNDGTYSLKTPVISVPEYTYDVFNITGEGTGGSFRGFRGNLGFVNENFVDSKAGSFNLTMDLGFGNLAHTGVDGVGGVYSYNYTGDWKYDNVFRHALEFSASDKKYQGFYFKNPAEKTIIDEDFYRNCGADKLIRPKLDNVESPLPALASAYISYNQDKQEIGELPITSLNARKNERDKRTQIITSLTAEEAARVGLQKKIISYEETKYKSVNCDHYYSYERCDQGNVKYFRKPHHLSEMDVLEADGKRYIYGIPAYNINYKEVTYSVKEGDLGEMLSDHDEANASEDNSNGRESYFESQQLNGFAHSFLLTAILSPDYVDITGDGITDDDLGTAIKFNYTKIRYRDADNNVIHQNWRMPHNKDNYNPGLRTDNEDDKALYSFGEREIWYLHSIETKNMVANFIIENRKDGYGIVGEHNLTIDPKKGMRKLIRIELFTKAEMLKERPKPLKTVHFAYSYQLCKNIPDNIGTPEIVNNVDINSPYKGKLTLESVWFTYNEHNRNIKNKYRFKYADIKNGINCNPDYNSSQIDKWGTYKPSNQNPNALLNLDYPYTLQNNVSNVLASAWNLEKILLPSGSEISVEYEADDYAFVQDRRAAQMIKIAGFAKDENSLPTFRLYEWDITKIGLFAPKMDNRFVFVDAGRAIVHSDIKDYLAGFKQLLLRLYVDVPKDKYGEGYEPINVYANIKPDRFGVDPNNNHRFWVELTESETGGSPIMETVIQFMKTMLPSKIYPGYDAGNRPALEQIAKAINGMVTNINQAVQGFEYNLKSKQHCKLVNLDMCFVRLNNPDFNKKGGGHRVKKIVIKDNWKKMIDPNNNNQAQLDSYYGQEYDYTKSEIINGTARTISSGVATYEPGIGGEENPFREVLQYSEKQPLGPTNVTSIELPVTESFFPSPQVGYSKVTVRSIHHNTPQRKIKSAMGKQVTEYYTCREFPVITDFTDFDHKSRRHRKPNAITQILFTYKQDFLTLSQGFRVILNDMHGKIKKQESFSENDPITAINSTTYYYKMNNNGGNTFRPDDLVPVINGPEGKVESKMIGRDIEVINDFRDHNSTTFSLQIPINGDAFVTPPFFLALMNLLHATSTDITIYRSATTTKIIHEYGILEKVENVDKGSTVSTNNLVYDGETGEPIVNKVTNAFDKPVYNLNYPAHWVNSGMDLAYKNIDMVFRNVTIQNGRIKMNPEIDQQLFESGDEIYVIEENDDVVPVGNCAPAGYTQSYFVPSNESRIWAVDVRKDDSNADPGIIFLDRSGKPYNGGSVYMRVIRSGKRNMIKTAVGAISSLVNPIVENPAGVKKIQVSNQTKVINASAAEFKERWKVEDAFHKVHTTQVITRYTPVKKVELVAKKSYSLDYYEGLCHNCNPHFFFRGNNPSYCLARNHDVKSSGNIFGHSWTELQRTRSYLYFEPSSTSTFSFTSQTRVLEAELDLYSHKNPNDPLFKHDFHLPKQHPNTNTYDGSHNNNNPHQSRFRDENKFSITRMLRPWPNDNNQEAWKSTFNEEQNNINSYTTGGGTLHPFSNIDFTMDNSNSINIKDLFKGMIHDKVTLGYWPGLKFRITIPTEKNVDARVCFEVSFQPDGVGGVGAKSKPPTIIRAKVSDCANAFAPNYTPAPQEEVDVCISPVEGDYCLSVFDKEQMNPYVQGVLGNWLPWRSYVYYGDRKDRDLSSATKLHKDDGIIDGFENFWLPGTPYLQKSNSEKWVWNSEITQLNRKGVEIENRDALMRYNAGIYGYQETLPVAVANNARVREIAFDGFEDYEYEDRQCKPFCDPTVRHFKVGNLTYFLTHGIAHTGNSSLKVLNTQPFNITVPIKPVDNILEPDLQIELINNNFTNASATLNGTGLTPKYYYNVNYTGLFSQNPPNMPSLLFRAVNNTTTGYPPNCYPDPYQSFVAPPSGCANISAEWNGSIVTAHGNDYEFKLSGINGFADDEATLWLAGNQIAFSSFMPQTSQTGIFHMVAGQAYAIKVKYKQISGNGAIHLLWRLANTNNPFVPIPQVNLYPIGATIPPPVNSLSNCLVPEDIKLTDHKFIDKFSFIPNTEYDYVLSAWVRQGASGCNNCISYNQTSIEVKADGNSLILNGTSNIAKPTGAIIEGWQRIELTFKIPIQTQNIEISLKNDGATDAFFDDIRIHPAKGNMKSFVYDPTNLRLAAELDENNYASFYEYDEEGTLVRVKKETKEGIKTISETRSALQKNIQEF